MNCAQQSDISLQLVDKRNYLRLPRKVQMLENVIWARLCACPNDVDDADVPLSAVYLIDGASIPIIYSFSPSGTPEVSF